MSSTSSAPASRVRLVVPWFSVVVVAAFAGLLLTPAGDRMRPAVAWTLATLVVLAALANAVLTHRTVVRGDAVSQQREDEHAALEGQSAALGRALDAVVHEQLPAFLAGERGHALPALPSPAGERVAEAAAALDLARQERVARDGAVEAAVVALARKVQASAHRLQGEAAWLAQRHPVDPDALRTAVQIDHAAAEHARQAQNLATLCGESPGEQWDEPLPLTDVVRGAAGRITAFHRVDMSGDPGVVITARAAAPLMHLLAELLANATESSPPSTRVLVGLRTVQRGAVVEIDDCGAGLDGRQLERAREIASGRRAITIADLGAVPQTGLAVVGTYARRHGFRVELTDSVYGGLRAVVMVPGDLVEPTPAVEEPLAEEAWPSELPLAAVADAMSVGAVGLEPAYLRRDAPALPQRQSRRADAVPLPERPSTAGLVASQTAEAAGAWMGAFFGGLRSTHPDLGAGPPTAGGGRPDGGAAAG